MASKKKLKQRIQALKEATKQAQIETGDVMQANDELASDVERYQRSTETLTKQISDLKARHDRDDAELIRAGFVRIQWLRENVKNDAELYSHDGGYSFDMTLMRREGSVLAFGAFINALRAEK